MLLKQDAEDKLRVYEEASKQRDIFDVVVRSLAEGISSRGVNRATQGAISRGSASRMWVEQSGEQPELFRLRDLSKLDLIGLQIEGMFVGKKICIVIVLGIDLEGI